MASHTIPALYGQPALDETPDLSCDEYLEEMADSIDERNFPVPGIVTALVLSVGLWSMILACFGVIKL
ncbi:MAG: hypothetical protein JST11_16850 [Acidobacteria bacterium]|nr:hypothetical protein [Acidobacteriota bacterium]